MSETRGAAAFSQALQLSPQGRGRYDVTLHAAWKQGPGVVGGVQAALLLDAMAAEVDDPARLPRNLTVHFVSSARPGPARCQVDLVRAGRHLSSVCARLIGADDAVIATAMATFATGRAPTRGQAQPLMPDAPAWETLPDSRHGESPPAFTALCTFRDCLGERVFSGAPQAWLGGWGRLNESVALTPAYLTFLADAWPPAMLACHERFCPVASVAMTLHFHVGAGEHDLPAGTPILYEARAPASTAGYSEEVAQLWAPDGRLLVTARQQVVAFG